MRHIGHIIGMMVRAEARGRGIGAQLLEACIAEARHAGLEMLTLSVTGGNASAIRLYERHRFVAYGNLRRALKVGTTYHDKLHMVLVALSVGRRRGGAVRRRCAGSPAGARSRRRCPD